MVKNRHVLFISTAGLILIGLILIGVAVSLWVIRSRSESLSFSRLPDPANVQPAAELTLATGSAVLTRSSQSQVVSTESRTALTNGTVVTTGPDTLAVIRFRGNTVARLGPHTTVRINNLTKTDKNLFQEAGQLYLRFAKLAGVTESIALETPVVVTTIRGTRLAQFVTDAHETRVVSLENQLEVSPKTAGRVSSAAGTIILKTGEEVTITDKEGAKPAAKSKALDWRETEFVGLNEKADAAPDDRIYLSAAAKVYFTPPTPTPTPSRPPTPTPKPTSPPIVYSTGMPGEGFNRVNVRTDAGNYSLTCVGANKNSVRVVTDSGNDGDCRDNCNVMPLTDYVSRNGGFAGMNGLYYCPADYDWCAGKVNSFDTLFFNSRNKHYYNSDNNVYSAIPFLAIEANGNPLFKRHSYEWGRDGGIQAGTAGNPLMIADGRNVVGDYTLDTKMQTVKSVRTAFVQEGELIYLCAIPGATVYDAAKVYETVGADNAINFDSGGTTALWVNGSYIYGPGRKLAMAIIFVRK